MQHRKLLLSLFLTSLLFLFLTITEVTAQMMGNGYYSNQPSVTTSAEDVKDIGTGKDLYIKFQNKQITCKDLQDNDFEKIGEYLMDQQIGNMNTHIQMNQRIKQMMGEQGEEQMHIVIGERATGCNANSNLNQGGGGYPMMGSWGSFGLLAGISMLLFWILLILAAFALIHYIRGPVKSSFEEKSSLDILKERYAIGEIDKNEFEEKKKELA